MNGKSEEKNNMILDGHKLAWHADRVKAWLAGERIAPLTVDCALTTACNYKCLYCYGQFQRNKGHKLTWPIIQRFLDDAREIGVKGVSFVSDGESTCSPHLSKAVTHGKSIGLDIGFGTNGSLLTPVMIDEMLPCLTYIRFNISAAKADEYARVHGCEKGNFKRTIQNICRCVQVKKEKKLSVTLGMQMVIMPDLDDQIIPLTELAKNIGVDYIIFKHCSDNYKRRLNIAKKHYDSMADTLKQAMTYATDDFSVNVKWSKIKDLDHREYEACYGCQFIMQISGTGLVAPCGALFNEEFEAYHIGNIAETSFKDLWKSNRYWSILERLGSKKFNPRKICSTMCLQHNVNDYLWNVKKGSQLILDNSSQLIEHRNFI